MKIVQSFWSGPNSSRSVRDVLSVAAGWASPEYHWMSWALSCMQLVKYYDRVELVTDEAGKKLLIDILKLPYTSVSTALQNKELEQLPSKLWAMPKIYTYGIQTEPFLHVDGDVYISQSFPNSLLASPLIAQNEELDIWTYPLSLQLIEQKSTYLPSSLIHERQKNRYVRAYNAGILGGTQIDFFVKFKREAFNFIEYNKAVLPELLLDDCFNTIPEQYLFYTLAQEMSIPITCLFEDPVTDIQDFEQFVNIQDFPHHATFLHFIGAFKRIPNFYEFLADTLRRDHPAYYYNILHLCHKYDIPLLNPIYHLPSLSPARFTLADYQALPVRYLARDPTLQFSKYYSIQLAYKTQPIRYFTSTLRVLETISTLITQSLPTGSLNELRDSLYRLVTESINDQYEFLLRDALAYDEQREFYLNRIPNDEYLYGREVAHKAILAQVGILTQDGFFSQNFVISDTIALVESNWDWTHTEDTDWTTKVYDLMLQPMQRRLTVWYPNLKMRRLDELVLDDFDVELLSLCKLADNGYSILTKISNQFPADEINEHWQDFQNMVYSSLNRMLYYGFINIV